MRRFIGSLDFAGPGRDAGKQLWIHRARALWSTVLPPEQELDFKLVQEGASAFKRHGHSFRSTGDARDRAETRAALKP